MPGSAPLRSQRADFPHWAPPLMAAQGCRSGRLDAQHRQSHPPLPSKQCHRWQPVSKHRPGTHFEDRHQHGQSPSLGRVRRHSFPDVIATMWPSDAPIPSFAAPVPLAAIYHGRTLVLNRAQHASATQDSQESWDRFPKPESPWRHGGLPGCLAVLFIRAVATHPAGVPPTSPTLADGSAAFRTSGALGSPG